MIPRLLCAALLLLAAHLALSSAKVRVFAMRAHGLSGDPAGNPPDPYLKVWCGPFFGGMTEYYKDTSNPSWSAEFHFPRCKAKDELKVEVWDKDLVHDDHLGTCFSNIVNVTSKSKLVTCPLSSSGVLFYKFEVK